jgi:hypothetical protein
MKSLLYHSYFHEILVISLLLSWNPCYITLTFMKSLLYHSYFHEILVISLLLSRNHCYITLTFMKSLLYLIFTKSLLYHSYFHEMIVMSLCVISLVPGTLLGFLGTPRDLHHSACSFTSPVFLILSPTLLFLWTLCYITNTLLVLLTLCYITNTLLVLWTLCYITNTLFVLWTLCYITNTACFINACFMNSVLYHQHSVFYELCHITCILLVFFMNSVI